LLRLAVLAGLAVGLPGLGFLAPRVSPALVLIAVAAPPVVLLALRRLEYGVLVIMWTAALVRFSLPTGTASRIVASLLMTAMFFALWLARMLVVDRRLHLRSSRTNVPMLAFILTTVISYVWSNAFRDPLVVVWGSWPFVQLGALAVFILLPGAFLLTANTISELRWLKLLCWSLVFFGALSLMHQLFHIGLHFLNVRGLFSLWFVSLAYAQALFNRKLPPWLRLVLFGMTAIWMYIYFLTRVTWLSGWLPPLSAFAAISLMKSKKLLLVFLLLMAVYVGLNWDYYAGNVLVAETHESGYSRLDAWEHNWRVTAKHWLFGTGPAGYAAYYMSYFPTEAMATHSNYIDILSQTGFVGLFFCLWFFGALGWTGYKLHLRLRGRASFSEGLANGMLAGWVGCIVAMGLGDWLFPFVYTQTIAGFDYAVYNWLFLGAILALDRLTLSEPGAKSGA
jgi:hypothetical protein